MIRSAFALLLLTTPAYAWEVTLGPVCTLSHETEAVEVELTHDPAQPLYSITLRRDAPWPNGPVFAMRFADAVPIFITTDRHVLSEGGRALTVTDRGFGNVLDGLQFNATAFALIDDQTIAIPLAGAAPAVAAFRECRAAAV
ncbi:MAG: hypothetical protein ACPGID_04280 [Rubricella sp.]